MKPITNEPQKRLFGQSLDKVCGCIAERSLGERGVGRRGAPGSDSLSGAAHCLQNFACSGFAKPQCGQRCMSGAAHSMQNLIPRDCQPPSAGSAGWASCMAVRAAGGMWAEAHAPVPDTRVFDGVQYSRPGPVSNKKQDTAPGLEGREGTPWLWGRAQRCWMATGLGRSPLRSAAVPQRWQEY